MEKEMMPREKALNYGLSSLNDVELLSLVLKSAYKDKTVFELAKEILDKVGGMTNLMSLDYYDLTLIKGIKTAKAMELLAILEIYKRISKIESVSDNSIKQNPLKLIDFLRFKLGFSENEEFFVIFLNASGVILKAESLFKGTFNRSLVGVDDVIRKALILKAKAIVVAHNHPSENCNPSNADLEITKQLQKACEMLGVCLLDHIIISKTSYYSFKTNGLM